MSGLFLLPLLARPSLAQQRGVAVVPRRSARVRRALVIGNDNYIVKPLSNAVRDAGLVATALKEVGFTVVLRPNLTLSEMDAAIETFVHAVDEGDDVVTYYSGHGFEVRNENYLAPIDFVPPAKDYPGDKEEFAIRRSMSANRILTKLEARQIRAHIVVLDACRDNPFASTTRSSGGGLAEMRANIGMHITFAGPPKQQVPDDGKFALAFSKALRMPNWPVDQVFTDVRDRLTPDRPPGLIPYSTSNLNKNFYFVEPLDRVKISTDKCPCDLGGERGPLGAWKRSVALAEPFEITVTRVTYEDYHRHFPQDTIAKPAGRSRFVTNVSWERANSFCKILGGDLPKEDEWEIAARSGLLEADAGLGEWCSDEYRPLPTAPPIANEYLIRNLSGRNRGVADRPIDGVGFRVVFRTQSR